MGGLSLDEQRTHFALWVMMASPLLLGTQRIPLPRPCNHAHAAAVTALSYTALSTEFALPALVHSESFTSHSKQVVSPVICDKGQPRVESTSAHIRTHLCIHHCRERPESNDERNS